MDDADAERMRGELAEAFVHPPRLILCGRRYSTNTGVLIVSHVAAWTWRTVIVGSRVDVELPRRLPVISPAERATAEGAATVAFVRAQQTDDMHAHRQWMNGWTLADDIGTRYEHAGGGAHGDGFISDFQIRFGTAIPEHALTLRVGVPDGEVIELTL